MSDETNNDEKITPDQQDGTETDAVSDKDHVNAEIEAELLDEIESSEEQQPVSEQLLEQVASAKDQVLRVQAEMQNVRRRAERDVENAHKYALDKFTADLLPVVDNLERALATIDSADEAQKGVSEGLELTLKSFTEVLLRHKIETIDPAGQPFDADLHQAVSMVPNPDLEPNTVMDVFQKGYTLNGRLVRPAMVVVSQA